MKEFLSASPSAPSRTIQARRLHRRLSLRPSHFDIDAPPPSWRFEYKAEWCRRKTLAIDAIDLDVTAVNAHDFAADLGAPTAPGSPTDLVRCEEQLGRGRHGNLPKCSRRRRRRRSSAILRMCDDGLGRLRPCRLDFARPRVLRPAKRVIAHPQWAQGSDLLVRCAGSRIRAFLLVTDASLVA